MYIAFRWLIGLSFAMWIAVCCKDLILKGNKNTEKDFIPKPLMKNNAFPKGKINKNRINHNSFAVLHCSMFLAGALAVLIFNRKAELISFAKNRITKINVVVLITTVKANLKKTAINSSVTLSKYSKLLWRITGISLKKLKHAFFSIQSTKAELNTVNIILLKNLKVLGDEKKNLERLLIYAIHENKNTRLQYQLESMAKSRLMRHIEQSKNQNKESRSRYFSFQQLYLVTQQENLFLKARVMKIAKEKEEIQKNFMELMNEIYKSKNTELKAYCSRFIVSSKDNFLNSDVKSEIQKFLQRSRRQKSTKSHWEIFDESQIVMNSRSWPRCTDTRITEIIHGEDTSMPVFCDEPKLKGLPGEYVWTVKDKDGIIEKLYEYDYEPGLDSGDTIRRIRQYSVYYDKDCLLDFSKATLGDHRISTEGLGNQYYNFATERFLTESEAFQRFLKGNTEIVSSPFKACPAPSLLCG